VAPIALLLACDQITSGTFLPGTPERLIDPRNQDSSQAEESDSDSLAVTIVKGTRVQQKLGPNIDTFLASMLLAEVKGRMPDERSDTAVELAPAKVLRKIERHQKDDGSFDGAGWAPILAQAMCGKGINRARQAGASVPERVLARAENGAKMAFQQSSPIMAGGIARLDDKQFIAGFGSNGGEEFLSYMNLAESLVVKGGDESKRWDSEMTANLNRVQNGDGSWSGHHCITGRTFCTSTALLVLLADRTPIPVGAKKETHEFAK
jgi:hypothetical protein